MVGPLSVGFVVVIVIRDMEFPSPLSLGADVQAVLLKTVGHSGFTLIPWSDTVQQEKEGVSTKENLAAGFFVQQIICVFWQLRTRVLISLEAARPCYCLQR